VNIADGAFDRCRKRHFLRNADGDRGGERAACAVRRRRRDARALEHSYAFKRHQRVFDDIAFEVSAFDERGCRAATNQRRAGGFHVVCVLDHDIGKTRRLMRVRGHDR
jgi:hypothetical protein